MSKLPTLLVKGSLRAKDAPANETPVNYIVKWIRSRMPEFSMSVGATLNNRILVIRAETGSGKSTTLPVAIFRILRDQSTPRATRYNGQNLICTQPRVLTAISLADDITSKPYNPDMVLGETVGYQTGPVKNVPTCGLIYATSGTLSVQLLNLSDIEIMAKYKFILVDEAHDRAIDNDLLLLLLKNFYIRNVNNKQLPFLLLLSATFDPAKYADYFGISSDNIIEVIGRTYTISTHWLENDSVNYPADASVLAIKIHTTHPDDTPEECDIMIFMPGNAEINQVRDELMRYTKAHTDGPQFLILALTREVVISQAAEFRYVFETPSKLPYVNGKPPVRRIILATAVAETGITINTLKYVIENGWSRTMEVYFPYEAYGLTTRPAPKSRVKQRKGRVGRLFDGEYYPLYTEKAYAALDEQQLPDIIISGPYSIYLPMVKEQQRQKNGGEFKVEDINLLDPPTPESYLVVNSIAVGLGFVSPNTSVGYGLTPLGELAAKCTRTSMEGVKLILSGYVWDAAILDLVSIVSVFGTQMSNLLRRSKHIPIDGKLLADILPRFIITGGAIAEDEAYYFRSKLLIADDFIEISLMIDKFIEFPTLLEASKWCKKVGLNFEKVLDIIRIRETIIDELIMVGIDPFRNEKNRLAISTASTFMDIVRDIKRCIYEGLKTRLIVYRDDAYYTAQNLKVRTPEIYTDYFVTQMKALGVTKVVNWRPKYIITDRTILAPIRAKVMPLQYRASVSNVSVMDGFVDIDLEFNTSR